MTKQNIVNIVSEATGLTKVETEAVMNGVMSTIIDSLGRNERVELRGFGTFAVRKYEKYVGRNPKTGEQAEVPSKKRIRYRMSEVLFTRMNQQFGEFSKGNI